MSLPSEEREPEHVHPYQTNRFAVHRGALRFRIAGRERVVAAGEEVSIPPGTPHHFWVEGSEPAEYRQEFEPALNTEAFFEALFGLAQAGRLSRSGMPPVLLLGVFGQSFWSTVRLTRPPIWVQWFTFAVLGPLGRLLGQRLPSARDPAFGSGWRIGEETLPEGRDSRLSLITLDMWWRSDIWWRK
ncbi:MAG: cupin domain-containing protein [Thermoflexus hugenholtzii]|uniref:cupin domain-containing protein n=1 Tax=Thermoflexus TaxID=1495649 RepID=UPI001C795435|nr:MULTISPECIES: cupin domain-containing protein [Thermoflexus]QWK11902.1 MAG: cupin domain-containing protein [Thermoflexus hugenholtzii]